MRRWFGWLEVVLPPRRMEVLAWMPGSSSEPETIVVNWRPRWPVFALVQPTERAVYYRAALGWWNHGLGHYVNRWLGESLDQVAREEASRG